MNRDRFKFRFWNEKEKTYFFPCIERTFSSDGEFVGIYNCVEGENFFDNYIVEQCTGLKDKNGKLIFDGDIIELTRSRNYGWVRRGAKLEVTWNTFNCCGFGFGSFGNLTEKCASNCIVVGNIHENPELLK